jgi:hypothetical protein
MKNIHVFFIPSKSQKQELLERTNLARPLTDHDCSFCKDDITLSNKKSCKFDEFFKPANLKSIVLNVSFGRLGWSC